MEKIDMAQISSILLSLHHYFLCNDIIIWFLYYLLYLVILLGPYQAFKYTKNLILIINK